MSKFAKWNREKIIAIAKETIDKDAIPMNKDWVARDDTPSLSSFYMNFNSWDELLREAGFPVPVKNKKIPKPKTPKKISIVLNALKKKKECSTDFIHLHLLVNGYPPEKINNVAIGGAVHHLKKRGYNIERKTYYIMKEN